MHLPFFSHTQASHCFGLALGGGGTRGTAHIGVLTALEEHHLLPSFLSGTSAGAFVAALYAFGVPLAEIRAVVLDMTPMQTVHFTFSRFGLLSNEEIGTIIEKMIGARNIEDASIPLAIMAADICTGERIVLRTGPVALAVMASSALPGVSVPVRIGDKMLVDGFIVENVPISPLRTMGADIVVAVNLCSERIYDTPADMIDVLRNAFDIAIDGRIGENMKAADVLIEPKVASYPRNDNSQAPLVIAEGYRAAGEKIADMVRMLHNRSGRRSASLWRSLFRRA